MHMRVYHFYFIGKNGHIDGPPASYDLPSDGDAIKEAKQLVNGHDIEVWQDARLVAYLTPDESMANKTLQLQSISVED